MSKTDFMRRAADASTFRTEEQAHPFNLRICLSRAGSRMMLRT
jgi:hypothetical protein